MNGTPPARPRGPLFPAALAVALVSASPAIASPAARGDSPEPETAAAPAQESTSAVTAVDWPEHLRIAPGETLTFPVRVRIDPEHHVMANPASQDWLIPLRLTLSEAEGITRGEIAYPAGTMFQVGEEVYATYHGEIVLQVPLTAALDAAPGPRTMTAALEFQGCSRHACRMPAEIRVETTLEVGD